MNWALDINTFIQIATLVWLGGAGWQRLKMLQRDLEKLEREVTDFRELRADIQVVKSQLINIGACINRLSREQKEYYRADTSGDAE